MQKRWGLAQASLVAGAMTFFAPVSAFAQEGGVIEEITVTARKVEESLQEVPISISAFSDRQMRERGIQDNYDVAAFTPNFNTSQRVGRQLDRPTIRGMANPAVRGEPNAYNPPRCGIRRAARLASAAPMECPVSQTCRPDGSPIMGAIHPWKSSSHISSSARTKPAWACPPPSRGVSASFELVSVS